MHNYAGGICQSFVCLGLFWYVTSFPPLNPGIPPFCFTKIVRP